MHFLATQEANDRGNEPLVGRSPVPFFPLDCADYWRNLVILSEAIVTSVLQGRLGQKSSLGHLNWKSLLLDLAWILLFLNAIVHHQFWTLFGNFIMQKITSYSYSVIEFSKGWKFNWIHKIEAAKILLKIGNALALTRFVALSLVFCCWILPYSVKWCLVVGKAEFCHK